MIGVPKEHYDETLKISYLDLLRPFPFATDSIDAIFMDELNRASDKVRNAVMEIIQKKSINGKKFNNLRFIWAAVNPEDDGHTYDVERLDPAQWDRFHIHQSMEFKPDRKYFTRKYGEQTAKVAIDWWNNIGEDNKSLCSPRRLDYALDIHNIGGDIDDVLDSKLNVGQLASLLKNGLAREKFVSLLKAGKLEEARKLVSNEKTYSEMERWFLEEGDSKEYHESIFSMMSQDRLVAVITKKYAEKDIEFLKPCFNQFYKSPQISQSISNLMKTSVDGEIRKTMYSLIPVLTSDKLGTNPVDFKPQTNANEAFSTMVSNAIGQNAWIPTTPQTHDNLVNEMQNTPIDVSRDDAVSVVTILNGVIKHATPDYIRSNINKIFGPLNYCAKVANINLHDNLVYKVEINKVIHSNVEEFLWIASKE
jgi:hypothetical protein